MDIATLNGLSEAEARAHFERACGSRRWSQMMAAARPFADEGALYERAERVFDQLTDADWREAFSHHPRIGDVDRLRARFAASGDLSEKEQAGLVGADEAVLTRLHAENQRYEARFGHVFLICASGKSAAEMLAALEDRIDNAAATELANAAREQRKITRIRLGGAP